MFTRALAFLFSVTCASAAGAGNDAPPSDATLVNTVRCEAGRAGQFLISSGFPANLKVMVSWKNTNTQGASGGVGLKVFHFGGSGELSREETDELSSDGLSFNLNPANLAVCTGYKKDIIQEGVGVYDCLINRKQESLRAAVEGGTGSASCKHDVKVSKKASAELKVPIWGIVDFGPSGSLGSTFDYTFLIAAPPPNK